MRAFIEKTENIVPEVLFGHTNLLKEYGEIMQDALFDKEYSTPLSFLYSPFDESSLLKARECKEKHKKAKHIFVVGIGGSDLGARSVYMAERGHLFMYGKENDDTKPMLYFFETVEKEVLIRIKKTIDACEEKEDCALVVISKSGNTLETIANAQYIHSLLEKKFGTFKEEVIIISNEGSPLQKEAEERSFDFYAIPEKVGGRFSVFTLAGLIPLVLAESDIETFLQGAQNAINSSLLHTKEKPSPAYMRASFLFDGVLAEIPLHEIFIFHPRLEMLGKWYRQLLAESLGKRKSNMERVGLMPTLAIGSTDLHSVGQLIFGGPRNRMTTFIAIPSLWKREPEESFMIHSLSSPFGHPSLDGKDIGELPFAIYTALKEQYKKENLPHTVIEYDECSPREIGAYMALEMVSVVLLASLLDVNAFDQPEVEGYKEGTRHYLSK